MDARKNFGYGTVLTPPSPATTGTSLTLNSGEGSRFPDPATDGEYNIVIKEANKPATPDNAEIARVTARSGDTFTITREQEGTTARSIVAGDEVYLAPTKKVFDDFENALVSSMVVNETPAGTIDGSNTTFTTASTFQPGTLRVYQNNVRLTPGTDFTENSSYNGFTMTTAPASGDILLVDYYTSTQAYATGSASWIYDSSEDGTITGTIDGSNTTFNLRFTPVSGTLILFRDGQQLFETSDYTLSGSTITFVTAPASGTKLFAFYQKTISTAGNADLLDGYHASVSNAPSTIPVRDSNENLELGSTATLKEQAADPAAPASGYRIIYFDTNGDFYHKDSAGNKIYIVSSNLGGWIPANEVWTYASATTVTVSGDVTGKYQKGDKVRLKQGGGWLYFFVLKVVYSSPNTTITLYGGDDYSLSSGTITDVYYSKVDNPQGFPAWFNITPTVSAVSPMTITLNAIHYSKFSIVNGKLIWKFRLYCSTGGTATDGIYVYPPTIIKPANPYSIYAAAAVYTGATGSIAAQYWDTANTPTNGELYLRKYDGSNWPLTSVYPTGQIIYEI